jgi:amidase
MPTIVHAYCDDALADHDAVELARRIRTGELQAKEVVDAAIARARRVTPALNPIALECFARASEAAARPGTGAFAGVPTFLKDTVSLSGLPTRYGSLALADIRPARTDDEVARQFLAQGFVVLGKSMLPEMGFNATTEPAGAAPTRNPWSTEHSSGGSSGGSAALVASGVVPLAHGNDGGGSLRIPAACCGLFALKPSLGRLPMTEAARKMPIGIVCEGVLTRSVRDTAHFYAAAEGNYRQSKLPPMGLVEGPASRRLRVGLILDSTGDVRTDDETRAAVLDAVKLLEGLGHRVDELRLPASVETFPEDFIHYWSMLAFFTDRLGKATVSRALDASKLDALSRGLSSHFRRTLHRLPRTMWRLRRAIGEYARFMRDYDVVVSPVLAHTTPLLGHLCPDAGFEDCFDRLQRYVRFTPLNNVAGSPAMSLPMGETRAGLPIGVHVSGRRGEERTLLELAYEVEAAKPWRRIQDAAPAVQSRAGEGVAPRGAA